MKFDKFFALAKEAGISESQIQISKSSSLTIKLFHHEIDNYQVNSSQSVVACGIYNGKFGSARTEKLDKDTFRFLIDEIKKSASFIEEETVSERTSSIRPWPALQPKGRSLSSMRLKIKRTPQTHVSKRSPKLCIANPSENPISIIPTA